MSDQSTIVLFADLSGSVQLYETLGDVAAKGIVVELQNRLSALVSQSSGVVQEIIGDELMCRFQTAEHAIDCAAKIHRCSADYFIEVDPTGSDSRQMRIGIHSGPTIQDGDRLFGDTINTAARIMSIAQAGQTITTRAVLDQLPPGRQALAREFDVTNLKGKSEPMMVYDIPWQIQDLTEIKQVAVDSTPISLRLNYAGSSVVIEKKDCPTSLGRAINNSVVVESEPVSRRHVSIEFLRGRFVLSDKSTNGTYVYPDNGQEIYLRREQLPLWGTGRVYLGAPEGEALDHCIEYCCEVIHSDSTVKSS